MILTDMAGSQEDLMKEILVFDTSGVYTCHGHK